MTQILDTVYFGRVERQRFFGLVAALSIGAAVLFFWLVITAHGADGEAVFGAVRRSGSLLDIPGILLAHGVSEHRTAGIMTLLGIYLVALLFALAARARDMGLWGWPTAFAAMALLVAAGEADPSIASLGWLVAAFFLLWPSREA
jgi:uncharacterized membrane protein YhaH (DUF805 family)